MQTLRKWVVTFLEGEGGGLEPVEIAVILCLIVLACVGSVTLLGTKSSTKANTASNMLKTASGN
jgi:Flp pilus assembly pilin Flp